MKHSNRIIKLFEEGMEVKKINRKLRCHGYTNDEVFQVIIKAHTEVDNENIIIPSKLNYLP